MKAKYKDKMPKIESTVSFGNLYDINKQLMVKEPVINEETLKEKTSMLFNWLYNTHSKIKYHMLLCHERRDYTVFNLDKTGLNYNVTSNACEKMIADILECMMNRGSLLAMELQDDGVWEIWVKIEDETFVYYLFPYSKAVLEY